VVHLAAANLQASTLGAGRRFQPSAERWCFTIVNRQQTWSPSLRPCRSLPVLRCPGWAYWQCCGSSAAGN